MFLSTSNITWILYVKTHEKGLQENRCIPGEQGKGQDIPFCLRILPLWKFTDLKSRSEVTGEGVSRLCLMCMKKDARWLEMTSKWRKQNICQCWSFFSFLRLFAFIIITLAFSPRYFTVAPLPALSCSPCLSSPSPSREAGSWSWLLTPCES